jgi:glycogen operon protein
VIEMRHKYPVLRRVRWLTGQYDEELEVRDLTWIDAGGQPMTDDKWGDGNMRCFGMLLDGRAPETGIRRRGEMVTLLIVFNAWQDLVEFTLPEAAGGKGWTLEIDTNLAGLAEEHEFAFGHKYGITGRSLVMFQLS